MKNVIIHMTTGVDADWVAAAVKKSGLDFDACSVTEKDTLPMALAAARIAAKDSHQTLLLLRKDDVAPPEGIAVEMFLEVIKDIICDLPRAQVVLVDPAPPVTEQGKILRAFFDLKRKTLRQVTLAESLIRKPHKKSVGWAGGRPIYGYRLAPKTDGEPRVLVPHEREAEVVRKIFELKDQGVATSEIVKAIKADKVLSKRINQRAIWRVITRTDLYRRGIYTNNLGTIGTFESMILAPLPVEST